MKYLMSIIIISGLLPALVQASEVKYQHCMTLVESNASEAVTYADSWIFSDAGGVPAGHCKALGLLRLGKAKDAALLLENLVNDMVIMGDADPAEAQKNSRLKVQLNAQAALSWKQAGDFDKSYVAYSAALSGIGANRPETTRTLYYELYLERGTLQILRGQYKAAAKDFTLAIETDAQQFEGFLQRAKAYRKRRAFLKARLDLKMAQRLQADHPAIFLESGILFREQEQNLEARLAWQRIIELYPDSDYAITARTNIDLLKPQL